MAWLQVGIFIFNLAAQYVLRPRTESTELTSPWEDLTVPEADLGSPIAVVFGTRWVSNPNVVWFGDKATKPVRVKTGGKK